MFGGLFKIGDHDRANFPIFSFYWGTKSTKTILAKYILENMFDKWKEASGLGLPANLPFEFIDRLQGLAHCGPTAFPFFCMSSQLFF